MQARGFLNYGLKYCWPKVFYCICQPNELEQEIMKKLGGGQAKIWGAMAHPAPPLRIATAHMGPPTRLSPKPPTQSRRHGGFGGLSPPKQSSKPPQIET